MFKGSDPQTPTRTSCKPDQASAQIAELRAREAALEAELATHAEARLRVVPWQCLKIRYPTKKMALLYVCAHILSSLFTFSPASCLIPLSLKAKEPVLISRVLTSASASKVP